MSRWDDYLADMELVELGRWVDEMADSGMHPEDVANKVIDDGLYGTPDSLFDDIVEYVEARRSLS
jgi:hypothetical protein